MYSDVNTHPHDLKHFCHFRKSSVACISSHCSVFHHSTSAFSKSINAISECTYDVCVWLLSLGMMPLRVIHVVACTSSQWGTIEYFVVRIHHSFISIRQVKDIWDISPFCLFYK